MQPDTAALTMTAADWMIAAAILLLLSLSAFFSGSETAPLAAPLAAGALSPASRLRFALAMAGLAAGHDEKHRLAA